MQPGLEIWYSTSLISVGNYLQHIAIIAVNILKFWMFISSYLQVAGQLVEAFEETKTKKVKVSVVLSFWIAGLGAEGGGARVKKSRHKKALCHLRLADWQLPIKCTLRGRQGND